jgi:predicted transcriptional regulator
MVSTSDIFNVLSDNNSLTLFNAIASKSVEELIPKLNITEKQCTAIISVLTDVGLVRNQGDKIYLTSLGKVFYYAYIKLSIHHIINIVIADKTIREILKGEA